MGPGLEGAKAEFSRPGGGSALQTAPVRPRMRLYAPAPKPGSDSEARCPVSLVHFLHGFAAVAAVAQALQLAGHELDNVTTMRLDMVNIRCRNPQAMLGASPAEGLPDQLVGAAFRPVISGIGVQVMPGSGLFADGLRLVGRTPALAGDHPAARVFAFPHGFQHAFLLPSKTKSQGRQPTESGRLSALALKALALTYIDDQFPLASAAVDLESGCHRFCAYPDQFCHPAARADQVPICCWQYYSTLPTIYHMRISPLRINNIKDSSPKYIEGQR